MDLDHGKLIFECEKRDRNVKMLSNRFEVLENEFKVRKRCRGGQKHRVKNDSKIENNGKDDDEKEWKTVKKMGVRRAKNPISNDWVRSARGEAFVLKNGFDPVFEFVLKAGGAGDGWQ